MFGLLRKKALMKTEVPLLFCMGILLLGAVKMPESAVVANRGAAQMRLNEGGSRGSVPFPHHRHQSKLGDCNLCHQYFPQAPGSINELKTQGSLPRKWIMNKLCRKCHRTNKREGVKTGPTTCSKCHIR